MDNKKKLQKIYSLLPKIACKKKCHQSCGVIDMSEFEKQLIIDHFGHDPFPTPEEIMKKLPSHGISCLSCPMLKDNQCSIYDLRPLICRLYGVVKEMKCPHGCRPVKYLPRMKAKNFFKKLYQLEKDKD